MTFPKLVVHAAIAGMYGGCVVALLLRLLNPSASSGGAWSIAGGLVILLAYTLAAASVWPALYGALRFFASHRLHLTWLSLRYLVGFHVVNTAAILIPFWRTLSNLRLSLTPHDVDRLAGVGVWLTAAWLSGLIVATVPWLRRREAWQGAAVGLALLALLPALRGASPAEVGPPSARAGSLPPARRLVLLNFDGADLDMLLTMQAQGKLPAFARLVQEGSYGRLTTLRPCVAAVTRTALVTGMLPDRNGVRGDRQRSVARLTPWLDLVPPGLGFDFLLKPVLKPRSISIADRGVPTIWEISIRQEGRGDAAGWEVDLDDTRQTGGRDAPRDKAQGWLAELLDPEVLRQKDPVERVLVPEVARAVSADTAVLEALERFETTEGRGVVALSFPGLDRVAHLFLRYASPGEFGNVSPRDVDLFGPVLERYYRRIDDIVGRVLKRGGAETVVLVTSTHGMEPARPLRRLREEILGGEHLSGVHDEAPPGFLFMHGPDVRRGQVLGKGSIADVAPTALYALGLPVARDTHGSILAGVFSEAFTLTHPVTVIGSYGGRSD